MQYLSADAPKDACILCRHLEDRAEDGSGVLYRADKAFVVLNAYPYNTGHLMVAPVRHVADVTELDAAERTELMDVACECVRIIREAMNAEGFNVGINLGEVAGAGVPGHVHVHVVPRWAGDTNFMPVVANTKVLPEMLADTAAKLRPLFEQRRST